MSSLFESIEEGGLSTAALSLLAETHIYNIRRLMTEKGLSEAALARKAGIPQPTLHKILSGCTSDPRIKTLQAIAEFFDVALDGLIYTPAHEPIGLTSSGIRRQTKSIPVISWEQCVDAKSALMLTHALHPHWHIASLKSNKSVALMGKASMEPVFSIDSILVVDLEAKPKDGDFVVVHYPNTDEATLRRLALDGPVKRLYSINNEQEYETVDESTRLLGVLIQTTQTFHGA